MRKKIKFLIITSILLFFLIIILFINLFILTGTTNEREKVYTILENNIRYQIRFPFNTRKFSGVIKVQKNDLLNIVEYKDGLKNGTKRVYYNNGILKLKADFKNGKLNGKLIGWNSKGYKVIETNFINDLENGVHLEWYDNGSPKARIMYKNSKKNGEYIVWYKNTLPKKYWNLNNKVKIINFYNNNKRIVNDDR